METKQVLKNAGKVALTVVSPPIGAMTWTRGAKRLPAFGLGIAGSFLSTLPVDIVYSNKELYNNPQVDVTSLSNTQFSLLVESFSSPIAYWVDRSSATRVTDTEKSYFFEGDTIISLNQATGNYELNFNESTKLKEESPNVRINFINCLSSLTDARKSLEEALSRGDVLGAKPLAEAYETKRTQYEGTRKTLDGVVTKMNAELDEQRSKLAGDKK